jgi:hypothetical protein
MGDILQVVAARFDVHVGRIDYIALSDCEDLLS